MSDPAIIRTEFASAEDAADVYGVSRNRVAALHRALTAPDEIKEVKRYSFNLKPNEKEQGEKARTKQARNKKRKKRAKKK
jgi:hypothetical protein